MSFPPQGGFPDRGVDSKVAGEADDFLQPTTVIDSTTATIVAAAAEIAGDAIDDEQVARRCFLWVRDSVRHSSDHRIRVVTCTASHRSTSSRQTTQTNVMRIKPLHIMLLGLSLAGCAAPDLPRGAKLAGGGLMIDYRAPSDGTAILRERTSGRIVATESLEEGAQFSFSPAYPACSAVIFSMFAPAHAVETTGFPQVPTNTFFQLFFVPKQARTD